MSTQNIIGNYGIDAFSHYRHAEVLRDAGVFYGPKTYVLRGQNLHMLLPYFMCDMLPRDLLKSGHQGKLLWSLPPSLQIRVESVLEYPDETTLPTASLGRPLAYTIPKGNICDQWFLLESAGFAAVHRQQDFVFLTKSNRHCLYYVKFVGQAYILAYAERKRNEVWTALQNGFPKHSGRPNQEGERNIFSVYSAPAGEDRMKMVSARFPQFDEITKIADDEIDLTELPSMPPRFNPLGNKAENLRKSVSPDLCSTRGAKI